MTESGISAATGFQTKGFSRRDLWDEFEKRFSNSERSFDYVQARLRSASDVFKKGGHVQVIYADRLYNLDYDNKRRVISEGVEDLRHGLLDTDP